MQDTVLKNVESLLFEWNERLKDSKYDEDYREALRDCIYELDNAVHDNLEAEPDYLKFLFH